MARWYCPLALLLLPGCSLPSNDRRREEQPTTATPTNDVELLGRFEVEYDDVAKQFTVRPARERLIQVKNDPLAELPSSSSGVPTGTDGGIVAFSPGNATSVGCDTGGGSLPSGSFTCAPSGGGRGNTTGNVVNGYLGARISGTFTF